MGEGVRICIVKSKNILKGWRCWLEERVKLEDVVEDGTARNPARGTRGLRNDGVTQARRKTRGKTKNIPSSQQEKNYTA